ncbi:unnamed protein product [Microthlaspi erraticum]|uniref:DUF4378 domain-containing protein n=1 Tax=Microthlaspi erraticum TaxID=1685480 RepID=A0A6D2KNK9_9BRAS|nr:unnamed protein product [Microthlaspi erraticum]
MEKRRSPRSSKSPGSAIFPKSPLVYESYKSGCGWKLINLFDFRHVKSGNKRLTPEKKFNRDSAGNVYTKSQLDLLNRLHDKCQCNDRIVEGENSCKPKTKRRSFSCEREGENYDESSKPVQGLLEREIKRIKNLKEETCDKQKLKQPSSEKNTEINLQVCVNEAAETFICSKAEEKGKDRSKQFMEALDILSSNKELFITLLQDPNSFSAKKGQDLEGSKVKEDEIVVLKPRLSSSSVDDRVYLRFKHLAKKLKLVVGSNKEETKPECSSGKARETEATALRTSDVSSTSSTVVESSVFRRKKRVESDVFKLSMENEVVPPRRFIVERQQERSISKSSPVYEVPDSLSSLQAKLKERRQRLEKRRESFKLWSLDKNFDVFDPKQHRSLDYDCTSSSETTSLRTHVEDRNEEDRYLESSSAESNLKQEQEQPSPVSVLERIHLEDETVSFTKLEEQIGLLSFDHPNMEIVEKDSVHEFLKRVLEASRLDWTNLMVRCNEETSLLDEFSHGGDSSSNKDQLLLVLDYTDEILRGIYRQDIKFWPFTASKSSRVVNLSPSLREEDLIQETLKRFDWSLLCCNSPRTLDQIMGNDLVKPCLWLDFGGESEGVVSDVVENILQQLVLEISHELRTMQRRICRLI